MIRHRFRKILLDCPYRVIDRAGDPVGGPPGVFEPLLLDQGPVILNAPESQISQEQAGKDDPEPEKKNDPPAFLHRPFHQTAMRTLARA